METRSLFPGTWLRLGLIEAQFDLLLLFMRTENEVGSLSFYTLEIIKTLIVKCSEENEISFPP